jgi:hypothetical protein
MQLKKTHPALRADKSVLIERLQTTAPASVLAYLRKQGTSELLVVLNFSGRSDLHFEINDPRLSGKFKNVVSGALNDFSQERAFEMQAWDHLIYTAE